jgi:hypothetical protein
MVAAPFNVTVLGIPGMPKSDVTVPCTFNVSVSTLNAGATHIAAEVAQVTAVPLEHLHVSDHHAGLVGYVMVTSGASCCAAVCMFAVKKGLTGFSEA